MFKKILLVFFVLFLILISIFLFKSKSNDINIPVTLWVWERPENLYFLKEKNVSFAYLAGTVTKKDDALVYYPRRQPLRIPDNSKTISVVRVEDKSNKHEFNDKDLVDMSEFIIKSCIEKKSNISCQIDFDAIESQTEFYKKLVISVREKLPKEIKLSLTALVSWCVNDESWFKDLPVDEVVPMFFRLGKDERLYWQKIEEGELKLSSICKNAVGISTDENIPNKIYLKDKPIYIFNNKYWSPENWSIIKSGILKKINE